MTEREKRPKQRKEKRREGGDPTAAQPNVDLLWVSDALMPASVPDPAPTWDISFDGGDSGGGGGGGDF